MIANSNITACCFGIARYIFAQVRPNTLAVTVTLIVDRSAVCIIAWDRCIFGFWIEAFTLKTNTIFLALICCLAYHIVYVAKIHTSTRPTLANIVRSPIITINACSSFRHLLKYSMVTFSVSIALCFLVVESWFDSIDAFVSANAFCCDAHIVRRSGYPINTCVFSRLCFGIIAFCTILGL
jgi:hypothetical protein